MSIFMARVFPDWLRILVALVAVTIGLIFNPTITVVLVIAGFGILMWAMIFTKKFWWLAPLTIAILAIAVYVND